MGKIKLKVHPTFIIFACLLVYFGQGVLFLNYLCAMFLHEYAHAFVAKRLGYNLNNIKLIPFGICLNLSSFSLSPKDEIKIALAGPLTNLFLCLVMFMLWWTFPSCYNYTYLFFYANFITCIFNLIPAFPLDGGRVLRGTLSLFQSQKDTIKICHGINIFIAILLLTFFIISCFFTPNYTYLFVVFCVLSGIMDNNNQYNYNFISFASNKKSKNIIKIKDYFVLEDEQLYKAIKFINNYSFINLHVYDKDNHLVDIIDENEYLYLLQNSYATETFKNALNNFKGTF